MATLWCEIRPLTPYGEFGDFTLLSVTRHFIGSYSGLAPIPFLTPRQFWLLGRLAPRQRPQRQSSLAF